MQIDGSANQEEADKKIKNAVVQVRYISYNTYSWHTFSVDDAGHARVRPFHLNGRSSLSTASVEKVPNTN